MTTRKRTTPDWLIERLAQGELPPADAADVRRRLQAEGRAPDEVVAALADAGRLLLQAHPSVRVAAEVRRRAARGSGEDAGAEAGRARARGLWIGMPLAAAGALGLALLLARPVHPPPGPGGSGGSGATGGLLEPTTIKGTAPDAQPLVIVYRRGASGAERLPDGARVARGDLLQLAYAADAPGFGVLLSLDGAGRVTLHWPEPGSGQAAPLPARREVRLPSAYELDDAPAFERFVLITAERPFAVAPVLQAARAVGARPASARALPLPLPGGFRQASLVLDKTRMETRP